MADAAGRKPAVDTGVSAAAGGLAVEHDVAATILKYDHAVVPGLLQIREYARLVFEMADVGDKQDITGKVEGRMRRQAVLLDQSKQFTILMTEAALRWRPGSVTLHTEQLRHIRAVMALPNIQIGILPIKGQAKTIYPEG
ncbi:MAG: DUF5753 domain-containing protein, partial [Pseudonocardiaceae bacterium]